MQIAEPALVANVEHGLRPNWERALAYLKELKRIPETATDLSEIDSDYAVRLALEPEAFEVELRRWKSSEEKQAAKILERKAKIEREVQSRLRALSISKGSDYKDLSLSAAPRPRQFKHVSEMLCGDDSPIQDGPKWHLFLTGTTGLGKTASLWEMLERGIMSTAVDEYEFVKSTTLFRLAKVKHLGREQYEKFEKLFDRLLSTDCLILDDLGSEVISEGAQETAFELLDTRCDDRRFTAISSNKTIAELSKKFGANGAKIKRRLDQFFYVVDFTRP